MNDEVKLGGTEPGADPDSLSAEADSILDQAGPESQTAEDTIADRFKALEAEVAELKDQLLRALAETENIRKRSERQVADERVYAIERFAKDLLSVSDNMARALDALSEEDRGQLTEKGQNLLSGVEMTQKDLHTAFARHGVTAIDAAPGATFDPNAHQAVAQIPSDHPSGTVAETYQTGWKIGDRTLRAAMVAVSSGPT